MPSYDPRTLCNWNDRKGLDTSQSNHLAQAERNARKRKDRFTVDFEKIFFFVKQKKYYFEQILEPLKNPQSSKHERLVGNIKGGIGFQSSKIKQNVRVMRSNPKGRNKRTVWTIATKPFKDAHFAVFPPEIPETCIKAGCPEGGIAMDIFMGSGTTAVVAEKHGRKWIGIELNPDYCEMAKRRVEEVIRIPKLL